MATTEEIYAALIVSDSSGHHKRINYGYEIGSPIEIKYGFADDSSTVDSSVYGFKALNSDQKDRISSFLDGLSNQVPGISFTEVNSNADLQFGLYTGRAGIPAGTVNTGEFLGNQSNNGVGGTVWLNHAELSELSFAPGSYSSFILLHELGHALGLKHPGNYNGFEEGPFLGRADDHSGNTIMSYNGQYPSFFQDYDLLALKYLYGEVSGSNTVKTVQDTNSLVPDNPLDVIDDSTGFPTGDYLGSDDGIVDGSGGSETVYREWLPGAEHITSLIALKDSRGGDIPGNVTVYQTTSDDIRASHSYVASGLKLYKSSVDYSLELADANTQGAISISDVILQLRHIVGLDRLEGISEVSADNDGSGDVGISDVIQNLRVIVGLSDLPTVQLVEKSGGRKFSDETVPDVLYTVVAGDVDLSWLPPEIV